MSKKDEDWLLSEKYGGEKTAGFFADLERLQAGEPLAYVIGWVPFLDTKIHLDSHPLIPRPETEYWVEEAIQRINAVVGRSKEPIRILDLCAGSGCVGVAIKKAVPEAVVDFAELEESHLNTIRKNLKENDLKIDDSVIAESNLFKELDETYHFILTNPPYIDPALDRTEESVKVHEPHEALYGGKDGFEVIFTIINQARHYLHPGGQLWIEHEPEHTQLIRALGNTRDYLVKSQRDQFKVSRFSVLSVAQ